MQRPTKAAQASACGIDAALTPVTTPHAGIFANESESGPAAATTTSENAPIALGHAGSRNALGRTPATAAFVPASAGCLLTCAAYSKGSDVRSAPLVYVGIPAGTTEPCVVRDVPLDTVGALVVSRNRYKAGFEKCATKLNAIREHDAKARALSGEEK